MKIFGGGFTVGFHVVDGEFGEIVVGDAMISHGFHLYKKVGGLFKVVGHECMQNGHDMPRRAFKFQ
ncbi:hypothetical protein [Pontiella agarivorans]|uniref:Uncharacterized protein n=1 Tax=Pontiella agarivorans TaxID=3038953 RepID=A0ABU5MWQ6_9BACT|nr:hypothetical protein [Pontiella agarivorans]MDZ8118658.1 hypothetical protein [Pontiella agarivorans]